MSKKVFAADALTGGLVGCLDNIHHNSVPDGSLAIVVNSTSGYLYWYVYDSDSALGESSPSVIRPDSNTGNGRWIFVESLQQYVLDAEGYRDEAEVFKTQSEAAWAAAALDAAIVRTTTAPATPWDGMLWWDSSNAGYDILKIYDNTSSTWGSLLIKYTTTGAIEISSSALSFSESGADIDAAAVYVDALAASSAEVNARCDGYPNLVSNKNASNVTVSTVTTIVTLDLGTVAVGDVIRVDAIVRYVTGATGGRCSLFLQKGSGTAVIVAGHDLAAVYQSNYIEASDTGYLNIFTTFRVTTAGTLVLSVTGSSAGSDSTVTGGWGQIAAYFENKQ